ncbi:MAG: glycosyltransferase, partial [Candidatus Polarisedimenticolia bacterium]
RRPLAERVAARLFSREAPRVARAARRRRVALIIDNLDCLWRNPAYARGLRLARRRPYFLILHDGAFPGQVRSRDARGRRLLRAALRRTTAIGGMSGRILEAVADLVPEIPAFRLSPLLEGPPEAPARLPAEVEAFLGSRSVVLSTSGAAAALYGLEDLLAAFPAILAAGFDAGLVVLLGSFTREDRTSEALEAARRTHPGRILVLEDAPEGAAIIARSRVYVRPSRVDSFGLALHEALLAGVPVVAADHPTRPAGVLRYPAGDAGACGRALLAALRPEVLEASRRLRPRFAALLEENRRATLAAIEWTAGKGRAAEPI